MTPDAMAWRVVHVAHGHGNRLEVAGRQNQVEQPVNR
jgi:hypothetical protein